MLDEHAATSHAPLVVRCSIPRAAADAIALETLRARAQEAGIADALLVCFGPDSPSGRIHVVADIRVASFLTDLLRAKVIAGQLDRGTDAETAIQCADAFGALLTAVDEAQSSRPALPLGPGMGAWTTNPPPREAEVR